MIFKYRYLPKKYVLCSFFLVFSSLIVMAICGWFGFVSYVFQKKEIDGWQTFLTIAFSFFVVGYLFYLNERVIERKCIWDHVSFKEGVLNSTRFGIVEIKNIKRIKINDLSNVYSFRIKTDNDRYKFSCLSFLGREGGSEYSCDKEALKSIAEKLLQFANSPEYKISVEKESASGILFALSCLTMIMLIPGFIYAPQRMIFVAPFVIPLFITLWLKRKNENRK